MRNIYIAITLLVLTACTTQIAQTTQQRYFAAKQDYVTVLTGVNSYATACRAKPTKSCASKVKLAQTADNRIATLFKAADAAVLAKEEEKLAGYVNAISIGISELRAYALTNN